MQIAPDPKPRKRLIDKDYLNHQTQKGCIYCGSPATEPHHLRDGDGPGRGSAGRKPDDYRALNTCPDCHRALHGTDSKRLKRMTEKIGRVDIYRSMTLSLIIWGTKQGWPMDEIYEAMLDGIIDVVARERGMI